MAVVAGKRTFEGNIEHVERVWGCRNKHCPDYAFDLKAQESEKEQG